MIAPVPSAFRLDRRALQRAFDRAAPGYDVAARLQRRVRAELLERLRFFALKPRCVLDLGAGTCGGAIELCRRFRGARVIALDVAPGMLRAAPRPRWPWRRFERVGADARALPLADASVQLVFSNLMLQWCDQPQSVFREVARVLQPGGLLLFSTFGPLTLHELRDAWAQVDGRPHVTQFPDLPTLGQALMHAGLSEPVLDCEQHCELYEDVVALMRELKRIGAVNAAEQRARGLTGPRRLRRMVQAYEQRRGSGGLPATFELIYGAAFGSAAAAAPAAPDAAEVAVPLSALQRLRR